MATLFLALVIAALGSVECINKTETFYPDTAISGASELSVNVEVKGAIKWHVTDDRIRFEVTRFSDNPQDLDLMETVFHQNSSHITLTLQQLIKSNPSSPAMQTRTNPILLLACVVVTSLLLVKLPSRFLVVTILILTTIVLCTFAQDVPRSGANIDIYVPRNFSFKAVTLVSKRGSIQINEYNLFDSTSLHCSTGHGSHVCPKCCSANGRCENGSCVCNYGYRNGSSDCGMQTETTLNLFVNPSSPVFFSANTEDGDQVFVIGEKDSDGIPTKVERFETVDSDGNSTYVKFDSNSTVISSAIDSDGMKMDFNWDVDSNYTRVTVSIYMPDIGQEIIVNLDLTDNITNTSLDLGFDSSTKKRSISGRQHVKRTEGNLPSDIYDDDVKRSHVTAKRRVQQQNTARVSVNVESCGMPENDAIVYADSEYNGAANVYIGELSSTPGLYYIDIPTAPASTLGADIGSVCSAIESALSSACDWYGDIKKYLNYALSFIGVKHDAEKVFCFSLATALKVIPQARLIPIHKFCRKIFKGINTVCKKVGTTTIDGEQRVGELICDAITEYTDNAIDAFRDINILFMPHAIFPGGEKHSASGRTLSLGPGTSNIATTFTISDGATLKINSLTIIPPDPVPHQSYRAYLTYQCYTTATLVTMTIVGTDSYTDTRYCTNGPTCVLYVPGAEALVVDTVTVSITDNGVTVGRQAIIVF